MKARVFVSALAVAGALVFPILGWADTWDNWRYAVKYAQDAEVVRMLDAGHDINMQNEEGWTALHVAADDGNERMVRYLLARGARTDLKTKTGRTAYDIAEGYSSIRAAIREKMALAADPFAPFLGGAAQPAVRPAPQPGAPPAARPAPMAAPARGVGIACAAAMTAPANSGRAPSARARLQARDHVWYNQPGELAALLDDCVEVNSKDDGGSTLLHVAAERDRIDIARMLVGRGASLTATDSSGKRAADYAGSAEMAALLGPKSAPAAAPKSTANNEAYCRRMWNEAQVLCGSGADGRMCRTSASVQYNGCLQRGTWY